MKHAKAILGYARALFELGVEADKREDYLKGLEAIASVVSDDLRAMSENPAFGNEEKRQVIIEIADKLKLDATLKALFILLSENRRLGFVGDISRAYASMLYAADSKKLLTLRSAAPLQAKERDQIVKTFGAKFAGKGEMVVQEEIDPELLGGVVVQIGSKVYDGSVRGRLNQLRSVLLGA